MNLFAYREMMVMWVSFGWSMRSRLLLNTMVRLIRLALLVYAETDERSGSYPSVRLNSSSDYFVSLVVDVCVDMNRRISLR